MEITKEILIEEFARQIDYALQKLIDNGLLVTGNYNKVAYDRTLWYAITKKGIPFYKIVKWKQQKQEMEFPKMLNLYQI